MIVRSLFVLPNCGECWERQGENCDLLLYLAVAIINDDVITSNKKHDRSDSAFM
jgi:hypothetical protein